MRIRLLLGLIICLVGIIMIAMYMREPRPHRELLPLDASEMSTLVRSGAPESSAPEAVPAFKPDLGLTPPPESGEQHSDAAILVTNKLQRLTEIRKMFKTLAGGDASAAVRAAKELSNENERETALLTLVTEWTRGEISPAQSRARAIAAFGLEAGLGLELLRQPDLALLWATELTEGEGRSVLLRQIATATAWSDPAAAFALSAQVPEEERLQFSRSVYAGWAAKDTAAALDYADQLPNNAEREGAVEAIRQVAPVGIGAELKMEDGNAIINRLLPGTPAELSGQLRPGDRIVALAQGDNAFVEARNLPLSEVVQMIRGAPGTALHLKVIGADAPPEALPRTVSVVRDQIMFKQ